MLGAARGRQLGYVEFVRRGFKSSSSMAADQQRG